jgi:hypothetical protein
MINRSFMETRSFFSQKLDLRTIYQQYHFVLSNLSLPTHGIFILNKKLYKLLLYIYEGKTVFLWQTEISNEHAFLVF